MKAQTVHMTDKMLRDAVIAQLDFEPEFNPAGIGVAAEDGVVTLSGFVDDYAQKVAAEKAVKRLFGVNGLANELLVRMVCERTDTDIAKDAIHILESDVHFPSGKVTVTVEDGLLTLEGTVEWNFQREAGERAVQRIRGVKAVANLIEVAPAASPSDIQKRIEEALRPPRRRRPSGLGVGLHLLALRRAADHLGLGYVVDGFGKLLSPNYSLNLSMFTFIGEVAFISAYFSEKFGMI